MAIMGGTAFNMRNTAVVPSGLLNGGGYYAARNPISGVNYALENEAVAVMTDIHTYGTVYYSHYTQVIQSDSALFTPQMVGSLMYITGGAVGLATTTGRYEIVEYIAPNKVKVDRRIASGSWNEVRDASGVIGGANAHFNQFNTEALGFRGDQHTVWISGGIGSDRDPDYRITATTTMKYGTVYLPPSFVGYRQQYGVPAVGDERPIIGISGYAMSFGSFGFSLVSGLIFHVGGTGCDNEPKYRDCKFVYAATRPDLTIFSTSAPRWNFLNCEFTSLREGYGRGIYSSATTGRMYGSPIIGCKFSKLRAGCSYAGGSIDNVGYPPFIYKCTFHGAGGIATPSNSVGVSAYYNGGNAILLHNTFVNYHTGTYMRIPHVMVNNIYADCAHAMHSSTRTGDTASNIFDTIINPNVWNCDEMFIKTNTSWITGEAQRRGNMSGVSYHDPEFIDASGGDFRLQSTSQCLVAGWSPPLIDGTRSS